MARGQFGERLKREREMREVSMDELTKATRISRRFIEALENEDWEKLPGGIFGHGFVRSIARYLGLDEEALLGEYDLARIEKVQSAPPKLEERIPPLPTWVPAVTILVILLLATGLFYAGRYAWRLYSGRRATRRSSEASLATRPRPGMIPVMTVTAGRSSLASSSSATASTELSISTSTTTRVRVLADGKVQLGGDLLAGETLHFSPNQPLEVTAGDSSVVLLDLKGQAIPPVGAPGASGTIVLSQMDLRQAPSGNTQP